MVDPIDPVELELVRRAVTLGLTVGGCCEWQDRAARRIRDRPPQGLTPEGIKALLCDFVGNRRGELRQVPEKREEYQDRRFYYKAIVPVPGMRGGLFVEIVLVDSDSEYPVVSIVNAHLQRR